jgi:5-methylcytosine-specific restriction endonuclease McrBC regulatory subunit McrC
LEELDPLTHATEIRRLFGATRHLPFDVFLQDRKGVRAGNVVGVVDIGILRVQILPKVNNSSSFQQDSDLLFGLISSAGIIPHWSAARARVSMDTSEVIEPILRAFLDSISTRIFRGIPRRYEDRDEDLQVLKGKLDFRKVATTPPWSRLTIPVRYSPLTDDNHLSRLLKATILRIRDISRSPKTRLMAENCASVLAEVKTVPLNEELVTRTNPNRLEESWSDALDMAQALVQNHYPNPVSTGRSRMFSLVFPVQNLFEASLRNLIKLAMAETNINLIPRKITYLLEDINTPNNGALELRPDFVFGNNSDPRSPVLVGDAKWKMLDSQKKTLGINASDAYQLVAYLTRYGVDTGILFFPGTEVSIDPSHDWLSRRFNIPDSEKVLTIAEVDIQSLVSRDSTIANAALSKLRSLVASGLDPGSSD